MSRFGHARRMWALDSPTLTVDANTLMYGLSGQLTIPLPAFLIQHDKGLILFDTGLDPRSIDDPASIYGEDLADAIGLKGSSDVRLDKQIQNLGFKLSDVTHVIASHGHFDHIGGLYLFPDAKFYFGEGEVGFAYWPTPIQSFVYRREDLDPIKNGKLNHVSGDLDLFGDGSLVILATPGHTPGEVSLVVHLKNRSFILTGDAVHLRAALDQEYHFPIDADTAQAVRTLRRLKHLRDSLGATIWITHDPEDWSEFAHAPGYYE